MGVDRKILSEIQRYHSINKYIFEQDTIEPVDAPPPPAVIEPASDLPTDDQVSTEPTPIDVKTDVEVEKINDKGESEESTSSTEELDITDLVKSQENIEKKQEEYFESLFSQVSNLEQKLSQMDVVINKLNSLEAKIEKYREKTPQEKLELRTYDSYPFNQKLSDFFEDKKDEMEKTGKHDYVLTTDQVIDINDKQVKDSFQPGQDIEY